MNILLMEFQNILQHGFFINSYRMIKPAAIVVFSVTFYNTLPIKIGMWICVERKILEAGKLENT